MLCFLFLPYTLVVERTVNFDHLGKIIFPLSVQGKETQYKNNQLETPSKLSSPRRVFNNVAQEALGTCFLIEERVGLRLGPHSVEHSSH